MSLPADPAADVVIMGAGAAGSLIAARLAAAGRSVVVLEAGPAWALADLVSSQIWARRLKWGGAAVGRGGAHPVGHNMATGWGLGGAALHHYAGWPRLHEADFRLRTAHGRGADWPFAYAELRPWYDRVQAEAGVSGDAVAEVWRPPGDPYPLPPLKTFAQAEILRRGFEKAGYRTAPAPMAILSREYDGRAACLYDGWCDAGCPMGALFNPLVRHLPAAVASGAVVRARAPVTSVATDGRGRAIGLTYAGPDGAPRLQPAERIVLAGGAVQNARLLLASVSPRHPSGFGNASGEVGRGFAMHLIVNAHGLFAEATEPHMGMSAGGLMSQDDYGKARPGSAAFGSITWGIAPALKPNDLLGLAVTRPELFGADLHAFMQRAARLIGVVNGICETVPDAGNRILLEAQRDAHGLPRARIVHSLGPEAQALFAHASREGRRLMEAAGAREAWVTPMMTFAHPSGGTAMGTDPATSVADAEGRLHEADNLWLTGGGLFPSIGAVSPTFTVLAMAERTAARMVAEAAPARG